MGLIIVKHRTKSIAQNDPRSEISSKAWNEEHEVTGDVDADTVQGLTAEELRGQTGETGPKGEDSSVPGPRGEPGTPGPTHGRVGYFATSKLGLYSVTGLGFRPKVIEFFVSKNDGLATWFCECHGFADDTGNQNVSAWTGNYSNTFRGDMKVDRCLYAFNASGALQVQATLASMDTDGFTLNFTAFNPLFTVRWKAQ